MGASRGRKGAPLSEDSRQRWDDRWKAGDWIDAREPAAIVRDALPWLDRASVDATRRALDVASGAGRNALWLAERGWRVLAVDLSRAGLRQVSERARSRALPVQSIQADLAHFWVKPESFDLVVNTHFLLRSTFPLLRAALKPGGLLLFETFSVVEIEELGGDVRRAYALERGELREAFRDLEPLLWEEGVFERAEGERGLARLVARKPAEPV